jgi:hypothetical protein
LNKRQKRVFDAARKRKLFVMRMRALQQREAHAEILEAEDAIFEQREQKAKAARTQMIRNRLTNQKRESMDRWNRFAGTEAAGAMGR